MWGLVGRETEIGVVDAFLDSSASASLAIVGEPGIGKTTIWQESVRRARERGMAVLLARPAESEARLAFAGLADLLRDIPEHAFEALPVPQRRALDVALLRAEADRPPGRRLVGTAFLSVLGELGSVGGVLVAVDDVQWLDGPSATALEFALRRVRNGGVRLVTSLRANAPSPGFLSALGDRPPGLIELGPLSVAALQRIISDRLGIAFPRPTLVKLTAAAGGNAFYALEIARLLPSGSAKMPATLPVPDDLRTLVEERIAALPPETRVALLRCAALARPSTAVVDAATLATAEEASLVVIGADGHVAFTHPLFASAVYGSASARERRAAHRELADVVGEPEERARHLALAATGPDEATAAELDTASRSARLRGAPDTAAELTELALTLTPEAGPRDERRLALADHLYLAGDFQRAADIASDLVRTTRGDLRARAGLALADIEYWRSGESASMRLTEAALADATDPVLKARCHAAIAMHAGTSDLQRAAAAARASLALLERVPDADPALMSLALSARVRADLFLGDGFDRAAAERALELESDSPPAAVDTRVVFKLGQWLRYVDDLDGSRRHLEVAERAAVDEGDESSLANIVLNRTLLETWSGNWHAAFELAERTQELFELTGIPMESSRLWRAYVSAHLGDTDEVRALAAGAAGVQEPIVRMLWHRTLGLAELGAGDPAAANSHLTAAVEARAETGFLEPAVWRLEGDAIEAAVGAGDLARAAALLAPFEASAARSRIPWSLAVSRRCRGLVLAASGDVARAAAALDEALVEHGHSPVPFEKARTLFVHGQVLRRLKQKRGARTSLEHAADLFVELGASRWEDRAREELQRTAARSAPDDLSATELRIAQLAANGMSNDAIASEVFVTRKTVEANLSRAYRKLGIRSRAQLARALDSRGAAQIP